jgi:UDP-arabinose 4-epimerase
VKGKVLVTGGAGYVGSHACKALAHAGYLPVAFDNLVYGHRWATKWGPLEVGDLRDSWRLAEVLREHRPLAVLHFAAFAYVGESMTAPAKYYENNVLGSLNLLQAMRNADVGCIVFSSTCATYGVPQVVPISESHAQAPVNAYGRTKLAIEGALRDFGAAYGTRHVALRYFNAAGADVDGEIGEDHDPETHAVPLAIATAFGERSVFEIFGTDYPTHDGTAVRDYVHVVDLAHAHVLALDHLLGGGESVALNLGTGQGHSVRQLVRTVEDVTGRTVVTKEAPRRSGDPAALVADPTQALATLGWTARYGSLKAIVESAVKWHRRHELGKSLPE